MFRGFQLKKSNKLNWEANLAIALVEPIFLSPVTRKMVIDAIIRLQIDEWN